MSHPEKIKQRNVSAELAKIRGLQKLDDEIVRRAQMSRLISEDKAFLSGLSRRDRLFFRLFRSHVCRFFNTVLSAAIRADLITAEQLRDLSLSARRRLYSDVPTDEKK